MYGLYRTMQGTGWKSRTVPPLCGWEYMHYATVFGWEGAYIWWIRVRIPAWNKSEGNYEW